MIELDFAGLDFDRCSARFVGLAWRCIKQLVQHACIDQRFFELHPERGYAPCRIIGEHRGGQERQQGAGVAVERNDSPATESHGPGNGKPP